MSKSTKHVCKLNDKLRERYPFIKQINKDGSVRCEKCNSQFSIASGGDSDIKRHLKTDKHTASMNAASSSSVMTTFFKSTADLDIAAKEVVWAYNSYRRMNGDDEFVIIRKSELKNK